MPRRTSPRTARIPVALQGSFDVLVRTHWRGRGDAVARLHAEFLDRLTKELIARDTFRTLLGPSHRDGAHGFAVAMRVPMQQDPFAVVRDELRAWPRWQHALHEAWFDAASSIGLRHALAAEEHAR